MEINVKLAPLSEPKSYTVIGLMSGTSLDGLDVLKANFYPTNPWTFQILQTHTFSYPDSLIQKLRAALEGSALDLVLLDKKLGEFMAENVKKFLAQGNLKPLLIANAGHTIFHQPDRGLTYQIGNSDYIVAQTGLPVIDHFRTLDVALGGQGAPLVPFGDRQLFTAYTAALNLGGIANISYEIIQKRIGYDVCPCNLVLNRISQCLSKSFDDKGLLARSGQINDQLLQDLNNVSFYRQKPPKSLGLEWIKKHIFPYLERGKPQDLLATFNAHISDQITKILETIQTNHLSKNILITGGGAYNEFLIDLLKLNNPSWNFELPSPQIIEFKEALIFAFLGLLRYLGEVNCLSSITGARSDSCGGSLHGRVNF